LYEGMVPDEKKAAKINARSHAEITLKRERRQKKRERKRRAKSLARELANQPKLMGPQPNRNITIEYVKDESILDKASKYHQLVFRNTFEKFTTPEELTSVRSKPEPIIYEEKPEEQAQENIPPVAEEEEGPKRMSKKKIKREKRLLIATLKQMVDRPDLVEEHDTNSHDPQLLCFLKTTRNSIEVPRHWSQKRKYLQGKRGIEKPPFRLPKFIADTGITQIRTDQLEADKEKSGKQKARERMRPKINKVAIDYQILHDAFFKHQTRPKLTNFGDMYWEMKEFEVKYHDFKPGKLSSKLREALHIQPDHPPPWLINMQRFGPPPSYPDLRIPGLNAPIPPNQKYGYAEGQWGKPPVDGHGRPLYGDPFGVWKGDEGFQRTGIPKWGDLVEIDSDDDESSESESSEDDEDDETGTETGIQSTLSLASDISGMTTPDAVNLRKQLGTDTPETLQRKDPNKQLFQVAQAVAHKNKGNEFFGSSKTYDLKKKDPKRQPGQATIALDPNELTPETMEASLKRKYDNRMSKGKDDDDERPSKRTRKSRFGRRKDKEYDVKF